jgi:hypothetical protein
MCPNLWISENLMHFAYYGGWTREELWSSKLFHIHSLFLCPGQIEKASLPNASLRGIFGSWNHRLASANLLEGHPSAYCDGLTKHPSAILSSLLLISLDIPQKCPSILKISTPYR